MGWCLEQEGVRSTRSAAASSYRGYGRALRIPDELRPGAILYFAPNDPDAGGTGHVTILDSLEGLAQGRIWAIGGNQGNAVTSARRRVADIVYAGWPVF